MKPTKDSRYWTGVIEGLDAQIAQTGAAIAALAERKAPLCLEAHLGCRKSMAEIEKISVESRQLPRALSDLETAKEQALAALQAAQAAEQHAANLVKAEALRDATFARLELCGKIDAAISALVDLLAADILQREELSEITGVNFNPTATFSLINSALAYELLNKRNINPSHYVLRLEHCYYRATASDGIWGHEWVESVNAKISELIGDDPNHKSLSLEEVEIQLQKAA